MSALPRELSFALLVALAAALSGCQVRNYMPFGNEPTEPVATTPAPGAAATSQPVVKALKPEVATAPIKTEDSVIYPQPRRNQSAPRTLHPALAVRSLPVTEKVRADADAVPMPQTDDPKVEPALHLLLTQARAALLRGEVKRSSALYEKAIARAPFNSYALHGLASAEARQGNFAKARSLAARSQFLNASDASLGQANSRLLEELEAVLASRAAGERIRRR